MPSDSSSCPDLALLEQLVRGEADEPSLATFEAHLRSCLTCSDTFDSLMDESDTCVRRLARLPLRAEDDAEFRKLYHDLLSDPEPFGTTIGARGSTCTEASANRRHRESKHLVPHLELPAVVSEYELFELLGQGAHGSVYKARHRKLDRLVAVKLLRRSTQDGATLDPFLDEMRAIGRLDHPNIIRATDAGESGEWYYLAMEYQPGMDVSSLVQQKLQQAQQSDPPGNDANFPLSVADACEIARQAAMALECVAEHGLVHRDIKPSNLLLTTAGQIKLLDLGLVAFSPTDRADAGGELQPPRGTANYMSPEQWLSYGQVDIRADLYSLGCAIYKLLVGRTPFQAEGIHRQEAHCHATARPLREIRDDVPQSLDRIVQRLLEKTPEDRIQTPAELGALLQPFCGGASLQTLLDTERIDSRYLNGSPRQFAVTNGGSRRRFLFGTLGTLGVTVMSVAGAKAWQATHHSGLRYGQWRALTPRQPLDSLLLVSDEAKTGAWRVNSNASDEFRFVFNRPSIESMSDGEGQRFHKPALLNLGQPVVGQFAIRVTIHEFDHEDEDPACGLFFRLRDSRERSQETPQGISYQSIEWCRDNGIPTLLWCDSRFPSDDGSTDESQRFVLAGIEIPALKPSANPPCELQVELGKQGFPRVLWNGDVLPESAWTVSFEGRTQSAVPRRLLRGEYRGHVGLMVRNATASFHAPELKYLL